MKNFLAGHGLVFNIGEQVEGYTNFFWILLLALLTKSGLPTIGTARVLGLLFSIGTLAVAAGGAYRYYPKRSWAWVLAVPLLLAANGSLAYWAGSGLETGLFTFLSMASALLYLSNPGLSLVLVVLAVLTRPEGALLAFLFGVAGIMLGQRSWKFTFGFWAALTLLLLPYAVFKYLYFGSLLPNPFYAKTGFSIEYWKSGLEYGYLFLKHYGLFGLVFLFPLFFWKKLAILSRFCSVISIGYGFYIISVGGDVLQAHRFFVPVLPLLYFPALDSTYDLIQNRRMNRVAFGAMLLVSGFIFYQAPRSYLQLTAHGQKGSVDRMILAGQYFAKDKTIGSFALSAIGAFPYYAGDQRVIDMLGLTEPAVARNPEEIEGLVSNWKERRYNAGYVLSQKPDVVFFSTGLKPSALAERALFLYPDFRKNYRLEIFYQNGSFNTYYRRFRNLPVGAKPDQPALFVNLFNEGLNRIGQDVWGGITLVHKALARGPKDCAVLYSLLAPYYLSAGYPESSEVYLQKGMELDGGGSFNRYYYALTLYSLKRYEEATQQYSILQKTVPNAAELLGAKEVFR